MRLCKEEDGFSMAIDNKLLRDVMKPKKPSFVDLLLQDKEMVMETR